MFFTTDFEKITGITHQKSFTMNLKQKIMHILYPLIKKISKSGKMGTMRYNKPEKETPESFYHLNIIKSNGQQLDFSNFKGKKVILVNTASDCGYTRQYEELQRLHEKLGDQVAIIAFPANDFGSQEQGSDAEITQFCQLNFGLSFPVAKKTTVIKDSAQHSVFQWLTNASYNGWNDHAPDWNFSKYIVDENGNLTHYFGPSISPMDTEFIKAVEN